MVNWSWRDESWQQYSLGHEHKLPCLCNQPIVTALSLPLKFIGFTWKCDPNSCLLLQQKIEKQADGWDSNELKVKAPHRWPVHWTLGPVSAYRSLYWGQLGPLQRAEEAQWRQHWEQLSWHSFTPWWQTPSVCSSTRMITWGLFIAAGVKHSSRSVVLLSDLHRKKGKELNGYIKELFSIVVFWYYSFYKGK